VGEQVDAGSAGAAGAGLLGPAHTGILGHTHLGDRPTDVTNANELNLQQMAWMQQMYGQYLTHYMQYVQSAGGVVPQALVMPDNIAGLDTVTQAAGGAEPRGVAQRAWPGPEVAAQGAWPGQAGVAQQNPPRNPAVVMNAGGGGADMDEEDEDGMGRNRDLLDWFYVMSRVLVLFSIVYFYSSFARFALVTGLGFLVYLYQVGFFGRGRRGRAGGRQGDIIRQEVENVRAGPREEEVVDGANVGEEDSNVEIEPVPEAPPNPLMIAATFLTTLFSSLIPEQPQVV